MNEPTIYTPKKLTVYYSGTSGETPLAGLERDLLGQNICIVCGKKPLTIEEMAEKLCMSAAFIEDKLDNLLYMNYLEKVGTNKYRTTFFVQDADYFLAKKRFELEHIPPVSDAIYAAVKKNLGKIREIGFTGSDLDENFLLWAFTTIAAHDYENRNSIKVRFSAPIRGDGGKNWIDARWQTREIFKACPEIDPELADYIRYSGGAAGKHFGNQTIKTQQFDPPIVCDARGHFVKSDGDALQRVREIIRSGIEPNDHDKEIITYLAQKGYVEVKNGVPVILIPFFTAGEYKAFRAVMDQSVLPEIESSIGTTLPKDYSAYIKKRIPDYLSESEKSFLVSRFYQPNAYTYLLYKKGLLSMPGEEEAKRICTIAWEQE